MDSGEAHRPTLQQRLLELAEVETKVNDILRHAHACLGELSKEKQITRQKMDESSKNLKESLSFVENTLGSHMAYLANVCVGTPHQGSTLAAYQKMALGEQCEHTLHSELKRIKDKHFPNEKTEKSSKDSAME